MKIRQKFWIGITIPLALLVTGCGQKQDLNNSLAASPAPILSPTPLPTSTPVIVSPEPTPVSVATPTPEQARTKIEKTYHMNKNYDIVPNDPDGNKKIVLLTVDDGPKDEDMIKSLIATLDKHEAKAIFFMNGYRIKQKPELLTLIYESGQILGNHAWDHNDLKKASKDTVDQQIGDVQATVKEITGEVPQFFRPPYGSGNDYVKEVVKKHDMLYMTWSNGSLDWEMTNKKNDPNKVIENVLNQLHSGSNILMHELPWTAEAMDKLLTTLEDKGYSFVDPRAIELTMR
ncbi:polysaccharide deacetylase family protein [Paenibacillus albiflavus]|uniref:Polysaccharide deacetylase family protein n=1 Tax=Paenibacillus albiflavus TaxID=2545760 RepID=A0A4V2WPY6_9BACL|nr:polysaccharide deacetylase family protein [Paenibacillus albiflavus]TCZ81242.1 polysaccharide deacetylase family protein [Paenibacillus albiflavus]